MAALMNEPNESDILTPPPPEPIPSEPEPTPPEPATPGATPPRFGPIDHLKVGLIFLTRLPIRYSRPMPVDALARAGWTFPLVGALVGAIGAAVGALALTAGLGGFPVALLVIGTTILLTGALHEDGLADMADGLGGGETPEEKLEIMRDSRIGSYGVLALVFSVLLRSAFIGALAEGPTGALPAALIAAHAVSRAGLPAILMLLRPARTGGLGAAAGRPTLLVAGAAALIGLGLAVAAYASPAGLSWERLNKLARSRPCSQPKSWWL
jgi:adenosylcobinamide-GDP ribazoletransferase